MTIFSVGLSIVPSFNLGCQTSLILSSSHRPLLSLTLVLICWLGESEGGGAVRVVLFFVYVRFSCHLGGGGLDRRAGWCWVGLGRLSGSMPDFLGSTFPLVVFLVSFHLDCVYCHSAGGAESSWCWFAGAVGR